MRIALVACLLAACGRHGFGPTEPFDADVDPSDALIDATALPDAMARTIVRSLASEDDDAEEFQDGSIYLNSTDIELCDDTSQNQPGQTVGIRFTSVAIPSGATIVSAAIQFTVDSVEVGGGGMQMISGQAADSAPVFVAATSNLSARPRTTAIATWMPSRWTTLGEAGPDQRTPDLSAIVQEIVARPGWAEGGALAFLFTGSGDNHATAYETSPAAAAVLHVTFVP